MTGGGGGGGGERGLESEVSSPCNFLSDHVVAFEKFSMASK